MRKQKQLYPLKPAGCEAFTSDFSLPMLDFKELWKSIGYCGNAVSQSRRPTKIKMFYFEKINSVTRCQNNSNSFSLGIGGGGRGFSGTFSSAFWGLQTLICYDICPTYWQCLVLVLREILQI